MLWSQYASEPNTPKLEVRLRPHISLGNFLAALLKRSCAPFNLKHFVDIRDPGICTAVRNADGTIDLLIKFAASSEFPHSSTLPTFFFKQNFSKPRSPIYLANPLIANHALTDFFGGYKGERIGPYDARLRITLNDLGGSLSQCSLAKAICISSPIFDAVRRSQSASSTRTVKIRECEEILVLPRKEGVDSDLKIILNETFKDPFHCCLANAFVNALLKCDQDKSKGKRHRKHMSSRISFDVSLVSPVAKDETYVSILEDVQRHSFFVTMTFGPDLAKSHADIMRLARTVAGFRPFLQLALDKSLCHLGSGSMEFSSCFVE